MKKALLLAVVAVFAFAVAAQASSVSFSWGANFVNFSNEDYAMAVGNATQLEWYADDFGFGVRTEATPITEDGETLAVTEIIVDKWLSKSVAVGLGIGSSVIDGYSAPVIDVRGTVQLLSGKGEKVNASLDFNLAARWNDHTNSGYSEDFKGTVASLAVTLGL